MRVLIIRQRARVVRGPSDVITSHYPGQAACRYAHHPPPACPGSASIAARNTSSAPSASVCQCKETQALVHAGPSFRAKAVMRPRHLRVQLDGVIHALGHSAPLAICHRQVWTAPTCPCATASVSITPPCSISSCSIGGDIHRHHRRQRHHHRRCLCHHQYAGMNELSPFTRLHPAGSRGG